MYLLQGFGIERALRIIWLGPNSQNLRRVEDVTHVVKNIAWSVIL